MSRKQAVKELIAQSPLAMQAVWLLRPKLRALPRHFNIDRVRELLPRAVAAVRPFAARAPRGKKVFIFATLHYWVEYCAALALALKGLGHDVTFAYLPLASFKRPISAFDLGAQTLYARDCLKPLEQLIEVVDLNTVRGTQELPAELQTLIDRISFYDTQYTLEGEEVDKDMDLYRLRQERNNTAVRAALALFQANRPDVALIPNGTILEFGAAYRAARHLDIPVVTFEFSEEREQIWFAQNDEVMRQNTADLWQACKDIPLTAGQRAQVEALEAARIRARVFGKSDRLWQEVPAAGAERLRQTLGLDARPIALLATNVIGDSLTLGRNLFSASMGEWILRTVDYFGKRADAQLVIRVHPGERYSKGPSMTAVIGAAFPTLPANVRVVAPLEKINTYDILETADLAMAFTTTVGLEAVMSGIPTITAGDTHYRGRGFTYDPHTWDEYYSTVNDILADLPAHRPTAQQVEQAWNYAYRFFFQYPRPFPWRLIEFWKDIEQWPLARLLGPEGQAAFGQTFKYLTGEPVEWQSL